MSWEIPGGTQIPVGQSPQANPAAFEESASIFMAKVYRWMFAGLAVTGVTAFYVTSREDLLLQVSAMFFPLVIGQFALVLALSFLARRMSAAIAGAMFLVYSFTTGLVFALIFTLYTTGSIGQAFGVTAGTFGALSVYGTVTKKNLSGWRTFLFMGLIGVIIAGVVQMFVRSPALSFAWSCACVVVFAGLTAYDTQKLRQLHASSGYQSDGAFAVHGALLLYLDFVNLFLAILRLLGRRR
jgi:uncharacterized protein